MTIILLLVGLILAIALLSLIPRTPARFRAVPALAALLVFLAAFCLSSFRYVGEHSIGVVIKNALGPPLPPGKIVATSGEKGPQARILPPGWHPWLWPIIYDIEYHPLIEIPSDSVGLLTAADGQPLPPGQTYAPEWPESQRKQMAQDAVYFLTDGKGYRGPQTSVLEPGTYRINPKLFKVEVVPATNIEKASVGVVKSNVGDEPPGQVARARLVTVGQQGIWDTPLTPRKYYINPKAYEVTTVSTRKTIVRYAAASAEGEEREIRVRTSDGFTFPVDVRIEYEITPEDAPLVVASVGDDREGLLSVLNSAVRAIFRNNAEDVKALDYVQQRSLQESQSLAMLVDEMKKIGVTVTAVRIGDVGTGEAELAPLLKTQTDREIALQEQLTFQEQQRAAAQKKELTRTEQEAEEERRLATARYQVQIAEQDKEKRIIEATAEAIQIKADAQAAAYQKIAQQIGKGNAAMVELLRIIGESGIQITPRVMVVGGDGANRDPQTTALIGTMLDTMVSREDDRPN